MKSSSGSGSVSSHGLPNERSAPSLFASIVANYLPIVAIAPIHDRYFANPRQRLQRPARLGRTASIHDRKGGRGDATAKESHVFQPYRYVPLPVSGTPLTGRPCRPTALQVVRSARAKADDRRRGNPRFRTGINGLPGFLFMDVAFCSSFARYNPSLPCYPHTSLVPCSTHAKSTLSNAFPSWELFCCTCLHAGAFVSTFN